MNMPKVSPVVSRAHLAAVGLCACLALASGCALEAERDRAAWLRTTLLLDNQRFFDRAPELTRGKLAIMADDLYRFVRGTAPQYARDVTVPGGAGRWPSAYLTPATRTIVITGDPHPENVGSYRRRDGPITLDFNDFDAATYGPYTFDLRRLALGLWLAAVHADRELEARGSEASLGEENRRALVEAAVRAYAEEIHRIAGGEPGILVTPDRSWGTIADELLARAKARGDRDDRLATYTRVDANTRHLAIGNAEPPRQIEVGGRRQFVYRDTVAKVSEEEARAVRATFASYAASLVDPGIVTPELSDDLQVARKFGTGVSSYPNRRYHVLAGGRSGDPSRAVLLEWKEVIDSIELRGLSRFPAQSHAHNGARVVELGRELHGSRENDIWMGHAASGSDSFSVRHRTGYQRGFSVERMIRDLDAGDITPADVEVFARLAGRILGRSHGSARALGQAAAAPAIAAAIGEDAGGLAAETLDFVEHYGPIVLRDYELFRELVAEYGFDLGYPYP